MWKNISDVSKNIVNKSIHKPRTQIIIHSQRRRIMKQLFWFSVKFEQLSIIGEYFLVILITILAVFALFGNSLIIYVMTVEKKLKKPSHLFILSLQIVDLLGFVSQIIRLTQVNSSIVNLNELKLFFILSKVSYRWKWIKSLPPANSNVSTVNYSHHWILDAGVDCIWSLCSFSLTIKRWHDLWQTSGEIFDRNIVVSWTDVGSVGNICWKESRNESEMSIIHGFEWHERIRHNSDNFWYFDDSCLRHCNYISHSRRHEADKNGRKNAKIKMINCMQKWVKFLSTSQLKISQCVELVRVRGEIQPTITLGVVTILRLIFMMITTILLTAMTFTSTDRIINLDIFDVTILLLTVSSILSTAIFAFRQKSVKKVLKRILHCSRVD